jgi:multidrug efflux system membrane fusion protein
VSRRRFWSRIAVVAALVALAVVFFWRRDGARARDRPATRVVPVVTATAHAGDMPVYLNGLGTATALNTVTVRSRVDGQLVSVNYREGQLVMTASVDLVRALGGGWHASALPVANAVLSRSSAAETKPEPAVRP